VNRPKKILIVDDEEDLVELMKIKLESEGYTVEIALDGEQGWQKVVSKKPDIVLADVMMPRMDGFELCKKIKGDENYKKTMVILVTAKAQQADQELGKKVGADGYLTKPFHYSELFKLISQ